MSYEDVFINKLDKKLKLDALGEKAERVLRKAIKEEDFIDLYGKENVLADKAEVEKAKTAIAEKKESNNAEYDIEHDSNPDAMIFEAILFSQGNSKHWFGDHSKVVKTCEYDDIKNGVDAVAEIQIEKNDPRPSHLGLAVDATFSSDLQKKFKRILWEINNGKLATVKYFQLGSFKGQLEVPRVVVSVSGGTVNSLKKSWVSGENWEMENHFAQFQFLEEIIIQLETFKKYAEKRGQYDLVPVYESNLTLIESVLAERKKKIEDSGTRDAALGILKRSLNVFV